MEKVMESDEQDNPAVISTFSEIVRTYMDVDVVKVIIPNDPLVIC